MVQAGATLSRVAFNQITGLLHPRDVINTARVMDLAGRLTSPHRPDGQTLWARLRAAVGRRSSNDEILKVIGLSDVPCPRNNRVMKTFQFMKGLGMRAEFFPSPWWSNELQLVEEESWTGTEWEDEPWHPHFSRYRLLRGSDDGAADAFTDGSTVPGSLEQSGYGVAIRGAGSADHTKAEYSGSCKASGNNYLAECLAMLCATQMCLIKIRSPSTRTRQPRSGLFATSRNCHGRGV